jgi:hypothetical protein
MNGLVLDKVSSQPVEGATVTIIGNKARADATTDSEGAFVVNLARGVEEGKTVRIRIQKAGYRPYEKLLAASPEIPLRVLLESTGRNKPPKKPPIAKPTYDRAHLAVVRVDLWAAPMNSEAMVTVRNIGSKPVVPCAVLRGAIITSRWLSGSDSEDQLFAPRREWEEGGKKQVNCDTDWNPGVEKTYSIKLGLALEDRSDWASLMFGEKVWYVVSRLQYRDSDTESALPPIESCVFFRAQKPEWALAPCFGHNDLTLKPKWTSGSGREGTAPAETEDPTNQHSTKQH